VWANAEIKLGQDKRWRPFPDAEFEALNRDGKSGMEQNGKPIWIDAYRSVATLHRSMDPLVL
jgi:hypothetical protein